MRQVVQGLCSVGIFVGIACSKSEEVPPLITDPALTKQIEADVKKQAMQEAKWQKASQKNQE